MTKQSSSSLRIIAIIAMMFLFAMISFVTNMAAPFGTIWKFQYDWAGMMGNMMNFAAYLFMGIPAGIMISKIGYKKTALVGLVLGLTGICIQYLSSQTGAETAIFGGLMNLNYFIYLLGAFVCGFAVCVLNTVVNPMLNLLGGGGNRGNQYVQIGGSLNSLAGTLTPMLAGVLIGEVTKQTSMADVTPLLYIAMGVFSVSIVIIALTPLVEPKQESGNIFGLIRGALSFRHLLLGVLAIFFYVGIEVGIPGEMIFYLDSLHIPNATAIAGSIAAIYWLLMLVGRFTSSIISGKVSTRTQLVSVSALALVLLLLAIFLPESITVHIYADVPLKCLFLVLCGLCTSVMWGGIFNLATEGLGKYTAAASGIFMTMVVGGGIMPLIQDAIGRSVGYVSSYWLVVAMIAYILWYALVGSKNVNKDIPTE
ncbi:MAG: MFS transporter [Paludibacteraceae bacterium]|nr:MFS transporter [Paludibacteraceae bacterium]